MRSRRALAVLGALIGGWATRADASMSAPKGGSLVARHGGSVGAAYAGAGDLMGPLQRSKETLQASLRRHVPAWSPEADVVRVRLDATSTAITQKLRGCFVTGFDQLVARMDRRLEALNLP
jgi:hypothetical protein